MEGTGNSKAALNLWCSKKKLPINYDFEFENSSVGPFTCTVKIDTISYQASSVGNSKKVSSYKAAFDMLNFLVKNKYISEFDLDLPCFESHQVKDKLFNKNSTGSPVTGNVNSTNGTSKSLDNNKSNFGFPEKTMSFSELKSSANNTNNTRPSPFWSNERGFERAPVGPYPSRPPPPLPNRNRYHFGEPNHHTNYYRGPPPDRFRGPPIDRFRGPGPYHGPPPDHYRGPPYSDHFRGPHSNSFRGPPPSYYDGPPPQLNYYPPPSQLSSLPPPPPSQFFNEYKKRPKLSNKHPNMPTNVDLIESYAGEMASNGNNVTIETQEPLKTSSIAAVANPPDFFDNPDFLGDSFEEDVSNALKKCRFDSNAMGKAPEPIGNFTLDNAKQQLHIFFQLNRIKTDYTYSESGPAHAKTFVASIRFYLPRNRREYDMTTQGASKQDASRRCALAMLHKLYNDGLVGRYEPEAPSKRQLYKMSLIYVINVNQSLKDHLANTYSIVQSYNQYAQALQHLKPTQSLNLKQENSFLYWCPPLDDYNPWTNTSLHATLYEGKSKEDINVLLKDGFQDMIRQDKFKQLLTSRMKLPIWEYKERLINSVKNNSVIIIKGSTGCGKTTQVPQFILDSYIKELDGANCNIIVTQPRRISAISIAERVAYERIEPMKDGQSSVGYAVRFDRVNPRPAGSVLFCTTGHLLRRIQGGLKGISHLIIDEVHERDINTDLLLIIVRDLINLNLDIRIIIMSATLGVAHFQHYFNNCDVIEIDSHMFPVERYYLEDTIEMIKWRPRMNELTYIEGDVEVETLENLSEFACPKTYSPKTIELMKELKEGVICYDLVLALLEYIHSLTITGSILIFLPGWNSIFALLNHLKRHSRFGDESKYMLIPLHSQLSHKDNNRIFQQSMQRKIILSTNIAETSITIDDVVFVIDTCLIKRKLFDPRTNVTSYVVDWVSRSNIKQRQGRAGRVRSGYFFVLCSRKRYDSLEEFKKPEILTSSLVETSLLIKYLGFGSVKDFLNRAIDKPDSHSVMEAMQTLQDIHAFDQDNELTPLGAILAKLPIDPRLGRMVIQSILLGVSSPIVTIAAASSIGFEMFDNTDLRLLMNTLQQLDDNRFSDHLIILKVFDMCDNSIGAYNRYRCININALSVIQNARKQLVQILIKSGFGEELFISKKYGYTTDEFELVAGLLVTAFYPNICLHKETRRILTNEERIGLIHKTSVFYSYAVDKKLSAGTKIPSPVFVYSEKTSYQKNLVSSKQMTMVTMLHMLMFGIRKFEFPPSVNGSVADTVLLDGWIEVKIDPQVFDYVWEIRTEFEQLITRLCSNPEYLKQLSQIDNTVLDTIRRVCLFANVSVDIIVKQNTPPPSTIPLLTS